MTTAIITFSAVLLVGLSYIAFCEWKDARKLKREIDSYPKPGKRVEYDLTENFYDN